MGKHGFTEKHLAYSHPVETTYQFSVLPCFCRVGKAQLMQAGGSVEALAPIAGLGIGSGTSSLLAAAQRDQRSIANMIEVLIRRHCDEVGISIPEQGTLFQEDEHG